MRLGGGRELLLLLAEPRVRVRERGAEVDVERPLERDAHDAERRATKRERVRAAARDEPDAEAADERVEAIRDGDERRDDLRRHRVARALRQIMVADRVGDARLEPLGERVVAPHQALQLGEFPDDQRDEVGLRELRGERDGRARHVGGRERLGERARALHLLGDGAELVLKDHAGELQRALGERRLAVLLDEEARVGEAGAEHAVVAERDARRVVRRVRDGQVARQELLRLRIAHREVALMPAHHRDDDLLGQREERGLEAARDDVRLLDEREALAHQELVLDQLAADLCGLREQRRVHTRAPLCGVREDVRVAQRAEPGVGRLHLERGGREEAMTERRVR